MLNYDNKYMEHIDCTWSSGSVRLFNTPTQMARKTFLYVQEVGYFFTSPPYFTERNNLNSYLIIYTLSGAGVLNYLDNEYCLKKGSVTYIDCNHYHMYKCSSQKNWEFLWIHFNGTNALGYYEAFLKNEFHVLDNINEFIVESTMRRILSLTKKKDIHSEFIISNLINNLITEFLIKNNSKDYAIGVMPNYIKQILKEIDIHFVEKISLDYLSHKFGVSKFHLSREFKRYVGITINEYTIIARLNHAKDLLKYSHFTIEKIAYKCGFNNVNHFINIFKAREYITPFQYRKQW